MYLLIPGTETYSLGSRSMDVTDTGTAFASYPAGYPMWPDTGYPAISFPMDIFLANLMILFFAPF